ncbi:DUF4064 domain-containing protein [Oceanobacillus sp. FSL W7-1293]|uniref:DUF4064 domain-containing protein n=1 Tax=Oceanobacillus sp. FSL W7-1293 TaxID=2921699 RepID=UPI0030D300A4
MKRTVEIVLGVIGMVGYGLVAALGGFMLFLQNNEDLLQEVVEQNPEMGLNDLNTVMEGMGAGGWALLITSILAIILSLVSIFLIKGNKRPKVAGSIFIVISILGSIVTVGFGIIPGIFLLISGIMCLVRKQGTL